MKKIFLIFISLFIFSCEDYRIYREKKGYIAPKLLNTDSFYVHFAGFDFRYRLNKKIDLQYVVSLKFYDTRNINGKYIIIEYQNPQKRDNNFEKEIVLIDKKTHILKLKSNLMYGMKQYDVYTVKIKLANDQYGHQVNEEIEQRVRVDCIPAGFKNVL